MAKATNVGAEPLGWSMGIDRWQDETRTFHLIVQRKGSVCVEPACGGPLYTGGIECKPNETPSRGHRCRSCVRILESIA